MNALRKLPLRQPPRFRSEFDGLIRNGLRESPPVSCCTVTGGLVQNQDRLVRMAEVRFGI